MSLFRCAMDESTAPNTYKRRCAEQCQSCKHWFGDEEPSSSWATAGWGIRGPRNDAQNQPSEGNDMKSPRIRSADEVLAGSSAIGPASSTEPDGHVRWGLVEISLPRTRVTAADARRIAKALKHAARRAEAIARQYSTG